ncbi:MAG: hypothetical protein D6746_06275 [Bacteroidetes bacterium]|nr:MAG: hypothetical protein D6746_06275 [Bacteroidota bacterium]
MEEQLKREEVEARLREKDEQIARRLEALRSEVTGVGAEIRRRLENPLVLLGVTLAGGLLVGLMVGRRRRRRRNRGPAGLDVLADVVARDAARRLRKGAEPEEAVREALADRLQLLVPAPQAEEASEGLIRGTLRMAAHMAGGLLIRNLIEQALYRLPLFAGDGAGETTPEAGPPEGGPDTDTLVENAL